jgi:hypothetical protein
MIIQVGKWTCDIEEVAAYRYETNYGYSASNTAFVVLKSGLQLDGSMTPEQTNTLLQHMAARKTEIKVMNGVS